MQATARWPQCILRYFKTTSSVCHRDSSVQARLALFFGGAFSRQATPFVRLGASVTNSQQGGARFPPCAAAPPRRATFRAFGRQHFPLCIRFRLCPHTHFSPFRDAEMHRKEGKVARKTPISNYFHKKTIFFLKKFAHALSTTYLCIAFGKHLHAQGGCTGGGERTKCFRQRERKQKRNTKTTQIINHKANERAAP